MKRISNSNRWVYQSRIKSLHWVFQMYLKSFYVMLNKKHQELRYVHKRPRSMTHVPNQANQAQCELTSSFLKQLLQESGVQCMIWNP